MLSVLADNNWDGPVQGINQIQAKEVAKYGPGNYKPILWVTYWTFRIMVGCGILMLLLLAAGLWAHAPAATGTVRLGSCGSRFFAIALPFVANTTGWIFTEMGRQPWVVYGTAQDLPKPSRTSARATS